MRDRYDEIIKINKQVSMKYGVREGIWFLMKIFALYLVVFVLFSFIIPSQKISNIMDNTELIVLIILAISIYQVVVRYKWMRRRLDVSSVIRDIKREDKYQFISIREGRAKCKSLVDISEKKLEFVKFFSTIPFLIYGLGIFINTERNINDIIYTNFLDLSLKEMVFYLALIFTIVYISIFISIFKEYKDNKDDLLEYEKAEIRVMGEKESKEL